MARFNSETLSRQWPCSAAATICSGENVAAAPVPDGALACCGQILGANKKLYVEKTKKIARSECLDILRDAKFHSLHLVNRTAKKK